MAKQVEGRNAPLLLCLIFSFMFVSGCFIRRPGISESPRLPDTDGFLCLLSEVMSSLRSKCEALYDYGRLIGDEVLAELLNLIARDVHAIGVEIMELMNLWMFDGFTTNALVWLSSYKLELICCTLIAYLIYMTRRENVEYSKLVKELKLVRRVTEHYCWQIDVNSSDMDALTSRLVKNKQNRIPGLTKDLEALFKMVDIREHQLINTEEDLSVWRPTMIGQINKLRKLNKMLAERHCDRIREIRRIEQAAGDKIAHTAEKLHDRIVEVKCILEQTSKLMDIKGIPIREDYSNVVAC